MRVGEFFIFVDYLLLSCQIFIMTAVRMRGNTMWLGFVANSFLTLSEG